MRREGQRPISTAVRTTTRVISRKSARGSGRPQAGGNDGVGPQALIAAACELLKTLPPSKVTRAAVARAAGVDPGLIRYHFGDNHGLLRATAEHLSREFATYASNAASPSESAEDQLRARIRAFLEFQIDNPFFHRLMSEELLGAGGQPSAQLLREVSLRGSAGWARVIDAGAVDGTMRQIDPILFYLCIIGIVEIASVGRPILREVDHPLAAASDYSSQFSQFLVDLLMNGLRVR